MARKTAATVLAVGSVSFFGIGIGYWRGYDTFNGIYSGIVTAFTGKAPPTSFDTGFVIATCLIGAFLGILCIAALRSD